MALQKFTQLRSSTSWQNVSANFVCACSVNVWNLDLYLCVYAPPYIVMRILMQSID
jgi:hypothetical protein